MEPFAHPVFFRSEYIAMVRYILQIVWCCLDKLSLTHCESTLVIQVARSFDPLQQFIDRLFVLEVMDYYSGLESLPSTSVASILNKSCISIGCSNMPRSNS